MVIGSNSIAVYMAAHLFDFRNIGNIFVKGWTTNHYVGVADGVCGWIGPGPWSNFVEALAAFVVIWLVTWIEGMPFCSFSKRAFNIHLCGCV